jgi:hypothetical protein
VFGAVAAGFRAVGHLLVVFDAIARFSALVAAGGAALEHWGGQRTLSGAKRRAGFAALRAVAAVLGRLGVLLFGFAGEGQAVFEAGIAYELAAGANRGALVEVLGMFSGALGRLKRYEANGQ